MTIARLNGLVLPAEERFKRDTRAPKEAWLPDFESKYDFYTLYYDAIFFPKIRRICLICPPLLNLERVLKNGILSCEGRRLSISRIYRLKRYNEVWLKCPVNPRILRFEYNDLTFDVTLSVQDTEIFKDLNCAVLKSKDNDLIWIREWADYHVRIHNLQGILFFDNNSKKYDMPEIVETLRSVPGLQKSCIVPTPYSFGPLTAGKGGHDSKFLQLGIQNIARLRFMSSARAVLSVDIDELVSPTPEGSIFDTAHRSLLGYVLFNGYWRHAQYKKDGLFRHSDHIYKTDDEIYKKTKYCICPGGLLGFSHWDVHGAVRGLLKDSLVTSRVHYWHCRQISTNWKGNRGDVILDPLYLDEKMASLFTGNEQQESPTAQGALLTAFS